MNGENSPADGGARLAYLDALQAADLIMLTLHRRFDRGEDSRDTGDPIRTTLMRES